MADLRPADDLTIPDDERLYKRVFPSADAIVLLEGGGYRLNSGTFKGPFRDEPMSVDLGSLCTPEQTKDRGTNGIFHVAMLTAAQVRALGYRIARDPIIDEDPQNPAHAIILGSRASGNDQVGALTNGEYEKLARIARLVLAAPGHQIPG